MTENRLATLIYIFIGLLCGIGCIVGAVSFGGKVYRWRRRGLRVEGRVFNYVYEPRRGRYRHGRHVATIEFTDHQGQQVTFQESRKLPIGRAVPIVYLENSPSSPRVNVSIRKDLAKIIAYLLAGILILPISLLLFIAAIFRAG